MATNTNTQVIIETKEHLMKLLSNAQGDLAHTQYMQTVAPGLATMILLIFIPLLVIGIIMVIVALNKDAEGLFFLGIIMTIIGVVVIVFWATPMVYDIFIGFDAKILALEAKIAELQLQIATLP